jgi:hypothetical protein
MKISRLGYAAAAWTLLSACARAPEAAAPAASSNGAAEVTTKTSPSSEGQVFVPPPGPASPAAAPKGLDDRDEKADAPAEEEFTNLEAAERALNQAKADLDRLALAEPSPIVGRQRAADRVPEKKAAKRDAAPSTGAQASSAPSALCENACRAFTSLARAAGAVCRLDGKSGAHCTHAKRVVADSQPKIAHCACPVPAD